MVTSTKLNSSFVVKYVDGVDKAGKEIIKSQRFSKLKTSAAEQDIFDVTMEIENILGRTLKEVVREDLTGITKA